MTVITPADAKINIVHRFLEGGALNECCGPIPIEVGRCRALKFLRVFLGTHTDGRRYLTITVVAGREDVGVRKYSVIDTLVKNTRSFDLTRA